MKLKRKLLIMIVMICYYSNLNKKVTSIKSKHVLVENKLTELSKKVEVLSTKGLTADLIDKYSILNGAKYFSSSRL